MAVPFGRAPFAPPDKSSIPAGAPAARRSLAQFRFRSGLPPRSRLGDPPKGRFTSTMFALEPQRKQTGVLVGLITVVLLAAALAGIVPATTSAATARGLATHASANSLAACGQVPVPLASTASYAVLAHSTVTNTGNSALTGDVGLSPGTSITGFPPGTITGTQNITTPGAAGAEANLTVAYNNASGRSNCAVSVAGNIGGQTLTPGLYKSTSSLAISSGDLTLSGGGNPNGVFIFQVASAFTTTSGRAVILSGGAQAGNVFWQIGSSATIGTTSVMKGTILAHDSISFLTGSSLVGRAMAATGQVSLSGTTIVVPTLSQSSTDVLTFTETGLATGTSWTVTLGGTAAVSTAQTLGFDVVGGTYAYAVTVVGYVATPSMGNVVVSSATTQPIAFSVAVAGSFGVVFTETGLASGTRWSVSLDALQTTSTSTTVAFTMAAGTYTYSVGVVSNYTSDPSTGSVTVNGAGAGQTTAFTATNPGNGTAGGGPGGGSSTLGGISDWGWVGIAVVAVAIAAIAAAVVLKARGKKPSA
jgi:hypothetical protein